MRTNTSRLLRLLKTRNAAAARTPKSTKASTASEENELGAGTVVSGKVYSVSNSGGGKRSFCVSNALSDGVASKTTVGGYHDGSETGGQFDVNDTRDVETFCRMLRQRRLEPVFKNWDAVFHADCASG